MRSVNKVILMGNLAADPEMRSTPSGKTVANFRLATNSEWRNKEGEKQKNTDFHRVCAWQGLAETCEKYLKKGSSIYLEGRLHNKSYEAKDKTTKYYTEITADQVNFIQSKNKKSGPEIIIEDAETAVEV
jgi:single-strand DNA-binding protein